MSFYSSGRYNRKLEKAYLYDKRKKELKDAKEETDTQERSSQEKKG